MDIYNLTKVDSTIDGVIGPLLYGFNIIGVRARPLVTFLVRYSRGGRKRTQSDARHRRLSYAYQASCDALIASPR
jgi:hypothetical protein